MRRASARAGRRPKLEQDAEDDRGHQQNGENRHCSGIETGVVALVAHRAPPRHRLIRRRGRRDRERYEGLAARQAALNLSAAGAGELRQILERQRAALTKQDLLGASDVNAELHAKIVELSGHATAQRLIRALNSQMVRFQFKTILIPGRPTQSIEEHTAIVDALTGGRPEAAERAMRLHLNQVAEALHASHGEPTRERSAS